MKIAIENKSKLYIALITTLISLIILVTGTYAWFTLSLSGKVQEMELKVTAGDSLYVDTVTHTTIAQYNGKNTVDNADINTQLGNEIRSGLTLGGISMNPVTSGNGKNFYSQSGSTVSPSATQYLQFDLYFIGSKAMDVYLAPDSSSGARDGTKVTAKPGQTTSRQAIDKCVRISFAEQGQDAKIYEPNRAGNTTLTVNPAKTDNGGNATMSSTFDNLGTGASAVKLFTLAAETTKKITVTIWIEGDDPQCNDDVKEAIFLTQLRFEGVVQ
jgi:hypothetical protein